MTAHESTHEYRRDFFAAALRVRTSIVAFHSDEAGVEIVEWVLILAAMVLPLALLTFMLATAMVRYYEVTSWTLSLPFP